MDESESNIQKTSKKIQSKLIEEIQILGLKMSEKQKSFDNFLGKVQILSLKKIKQSKISGEIFLNRIKFIKFFR